ncbi:MAG: 16S rRNA (guanine(527)-N(7))-methyltransferase RsmG [Acidimicrobiia bacterium]
MKLEDESLLRRVTAWSGVELDRDQMGQLDRYLVWLETEATTGGLMGPNEKPRLVRRHLADSLLFACGLFPSARRVLDVGSGAGLPGIPLAVAFPDLEFVLLERRGKRAELLRRVSRILDLENVQVIQGDLDKWSGPVSVIVSRATVTPADVADRLLPLLEPDGVVVLGGSWTGRPDVKGFDVVEVPTEVLDQTVWLLIMRPT